MANFMIDVETFGPTPGCAIASIGGVAFDFEKGVGDNTFLRLIDRKSCVDEGLGTFDKETIQWWRKQSEQARAEAIDDEQRIELPTALGCFRSWVLSFGDAPTLWAYPAAFDGVVIDTAYRACAHDLCARRIRLGCHSPIPLHKWRCAREIIKCAGLPKPKMEHRALKDAIIQAEALVEASRLIRIDDPERGLRKVDFP